MMGSAYGRFQRMSHLTLSLVRRRGLWLLALSLSACINGPAVDLAPTYEPAQFVVPDSWRGASPFIRAKPSDGEVRQAWWTLFNDPVLNSLEQQAMASNPDLQAAAERFVQARDMMMRARASFVPHLGIGFGASNNRQSDNSLFRGIGEPDSAAQVTTGGIASWEPDFWSALRNRMRAQIATAESVAADFALARLSLQAEIADDYFTLRGYDAQNEIYKESIDYYTESLRIIQEQFKGAIASALDVARAEYLLHDTEAKKIGIEANRQVAEHALAILVNKVPASFKIEPVEDLQMPDFMIPQTLPSTLLERRPDIAKMERQMAKANREIGIARAAFFPNVSFRLDGGFEDNGFNLISLANSFWSYGSTVSLPIFQGGYRRAQLQQSWSAYRETEDKYRATVLNAFREVENGLSQTKLYTAESERQKAAVEAALKSQALTMQLFKGGLNSSLDLIYAQIYTLAARINYVQVRNGLQKASVALVRSLGGGWNREQLPTDEQIQPFDIFEYDKLDKPQPVGGIDVNADNNKLYNDLTKSVKP